MFCSFFVKEISVAGFKLTQELGYKDIRRPHILHGALANVLRGRSLASTLVRPKAFHCACSRIPFPNLASRHRAVHGQAVRLAVQRSAFFLEASHCSALGARIANAREAPTERTEENEHYKRYAYDLPFPSRSERYKEELFKY